MPMPTQAAPTGQPHIMPPGTTARDYDQNGWFEVRANPLSKVGVFEYSGRALGLEPQYHDVMFGVLRPEEELSDPATVASFRLLPWVDDHTMLGPVVGTAPAEQKGVQGVIGEEVFYRDGVLYGNIKCFSERLCAEIESGKRELSAGYACEFEKAEGFYNGKPYSFIQRKIRGNHLASVYRGRMGPQFAVLDGLNYAFDHLEIGTMKKFIKVAHVKKIISVFDADEKGAKAVDVEAAGAEEISLEKLTEIVKKYFPQIQELMALLKSDTPVEPAADAGPADPDDQAGAKDPAVSTDEGGEDPAKKVVPAADSNADPAKPAAAAADEGDPAKKVVPAMDAAEVKRISQTAVDAAEKNFVKRQAQKVSLAKRLAPAIGAFDHAEMTLDDVVAHAAKSLKLPVATMDALESYLMAFEARPSATVSFDGYENTGGKSGAIGSHFGI